VEFVIVGIIILRPEFFIGFKRESCERLFVRFYKKSFGFNVQGAEVNRSVAPPPDIIDFGIYFVRTPHRALSRTLKKRITLYCKVNLIIAFQNSFGAGKRKNAFERAVENVKITVAKLDFYDFVFRIKINDVIRGKWSLVAQVSLQGND